MAMTLETLYKARQLLVSLGTLRAYADSYERSGIRTIELEALGFGSLIFDNEVDEQVNDDIKKAIFDVACPRIDELQDELISLGVPDTIQSNIGKIIEIVEQVGEAQVKARAYGLGRFEVALEVALKQIDLDLVKYPE